MIGSAILVKNIKYLYSVVNYIMEVVTFMLISIHAHEPLTAYCSRKPEDQCEMPSKLLMHWNGKACSCGGRRSATK